MSQFIPRAVSLAVSLKKPKPDRRPKVKELDNQSNVPLTVDNLRIDNKGKFGEKKFPTKRVEVSNLPKVNETRKLLAQTVSQLQQKRALLRKMSDPALNSEVATLESTVANLRTELEGDPQVSEEIIREEKDKMLMFLDAADKVNTFSPNFFKITSMSEADKQAEKHAKMTELFTALTSMYPTYQPSDADLETIFLLGSNPAAYKSAVSLTEGTPTFPDVLGKTTFLQRLGDFLSRFSSTPGNFQLPIFVLTEPDKLDPELIQKYKYQHNPYTGEIVNVDVDGNLTDNYIRLNEDGIPMTDNVGNPIVVNIDEPDGRKVSFNMLNDPDPVIGNFRLKDCYDSVDALLQTFLRFGDRISIPIIKKSTQGASNKLNVGHIGVGINAEIIGGVDMMEQILNSKGTLPLPGDINEVPIYICISNVPETYVQNPSIPEMIKKWKDDSFESDIGGYHSGFLIVYRRKVYSAGFGAIGGKVDDLTTVAYAANSLLSKGTIMSRDYLFDLDSTNLHVSDIGVLRQEHIDRMSAYINEIGYVNIGGFLPNMLCSRDTVQYMRDNFTLDITTNTPLLNLIRHLSDEGLNIDEIKLIPQVQIYYDTSLVTNYGIQYVLPKTGYTMGSVETPFLSDALKSLKFTPDTYNNLMSHTGTNCARFVQSIFTNRITCSLTNKLISTVSSPAQCRRLPYLQPLSSDNFTQALELFLSNDVDGFVQHTQTFETPMFYSETFGGKALEIVNGLINFMFPSDEFLESIYPSMDGGAKLKKQITSKRKTKKHGKKQIKKTHLKKQSKTTKKQNRKK